MLKTNAILFMTLLLSSSLYAQNRPVEGRATEAARRNLEREGRKLKTENGGYETGAERSAKARSQSVDPVVAKEINELAKEVEFLTGKSEDIVSSLHSTLKMTGMSPLKESLESFRKSDVGQKEEHKEIYDNIYEIVLTLGKTKGGSESEALVMDFMTRHTPEMLKEFSEGKLDNFIKFNSFMSSLSSSVKGQSKISEDQLNEALQKSEINKEDFKNLCGR